MTGSDRERGRRTLATRLPRAPTHITRADSRREEGHRRDEEMLVDCPCLLLTLPFNMYQRAHFLFYSFLYQLLLHAYFNEKFEKLFVRKILLYLSLL